MLKVLEKFWLTIAFLSFFYGIYESIVSGFIDGLLVFFITMVSIFVYILRRNQRRRMEKNNLNKSQGI